MGKFCCVFYQQYAPKGPFLILSKQRITRQGAGSMKQTVPFIQKKTLTRFRVTLWRTIRQWADNPPVGGQGGGANCKPLAAKILFTVP